MSLSQAKRAELGAAIEAMGVPPSDVVSVLRSQCTPGIGSPDGLTITNADENGFDGEIVSRSRFRVRKQKHGGVSIEIKP